MVVEVQLGRDLPLDEDSLEWAREAIGWAGQGAEYKGKPSAHWFSEAAFFELCQAQGPAATVHRFVQNFDGCSGAKAGGVAGMFATGQLVRDLGRGETAELLRACRGRSGVVAPRRLGSLGRPAGGAPYARVETYLDVGGARVPAVVEVYGSPASRTSASVLVNRTPVVGEMYAGLDKEGQGLEVCVQGCGLFLSVPVPRSQPPCRLTLSVLAPAVPLTSDGKAPDLSSAEDDIVEAVAKVVKKVRKMTPAGAGKADQVTVILATIKSAAAKASGGGEGAVLDPAAVLQRPARRAAAVRQGTRLRLLLQGRHPVREPQRQGPAPLPRPAGRADPPAHRARGLARDAGRRGLRAARMELQQGPLH
jgi:hypothetical protein